MKGIFEQKETSFLHFQVDTSPQGFSNKNIKGINTAPNPFSFEK